MSQITTHVLDTMRGLPAVGVAVLLERAGEAGLEPVSRAVTDADGRVRDLVPEESPLAPGTYRLSFDTGAYFTATGGEGFFPEVSIVFILREGEGPYHVPLLLSPYGYTTYRGS
ncbi:MAG TPA: hydroxyisourate hydrolase [Longimicrobium sp.]|nr:hydroxyisourate hydrolase [Longimicrobium sp.]